MRSLIPVLYLIGGLFFLAGSLVTFLTPRENHLIEMENVPDDGIPKSQLPSERLDRAEFHVSDPTERLAVSFLEVRGYLIYKKYCGRAIVVPPIIQCAEGA